MIVFILTLLKIWAARRSHSVGAFSESLHSFLDGFSLLISYFTVKEAIKPADWEHPFGHGKIETLSSLIESLLLILAACCMVYEGLMHWAVQGSVMHANEVIGVTVFAAVVSWLAYRQNIQIAKETDSPAIYVNALHFLADAVASLSLLVGFIVMQWTHWIWIDSVLAFGVAAYTFSLSFRQAKRAWDELSDIQLPNEEIQKLQSLLNLFMHQALSFHHLRTRKSGSTRHIDFHLVVCGKMTVEASHQLCDQIEVQLSQKFSQSSIQIHVEPCGASTATCQIDCARDAKLNSRFH